MLEKDQGPVSLRMEIVRLAHELEKENNAAFDLWTWLPSHEKATKHHGDYASEFMPSIDEIMKEACDHLNRLKAGVKKWPPTPCPCGNPHGDE